MTFVRPFLAIFFAKCMFIFNKTEVLTVILRCLAGLNLDWFKNYGLRCSLRSCACSAKSQKRQLINSHFTCISGHFFANYMIIFHKTKVQMVILRCLTGLNLHWFKRYGFRCKMRPCTCLANSQKKATDN